MNYLIISEDEEDITISVVEEITKVVEVQTAAPVHTIVMGVVGPTGPQGPAGAAGATGATGNTGPAGPGVPAGGTTGQVLAKNSDDDYDSEWIDPSAGVGDHGDLTGLSDDDHTQYHNDTRGDTRYYTKTALDAGQLDNRYYTETEVNTALSGKENTIAAGTTAQYWRGDKTFQTLDKAAVGLSNVDNTSDANKPVSTAQQTALNLKEDLSNKSTSTSLGTSNTLYPTQNAVKTYVDGLVVGLWDDRGSFDASGGSYPSSGGSGTAGAIVKGDIWTISVAGTLPTGQVVEVGDLVRALVDTPGNTQANWAITQNNIGYVAENAANKDTDGTLAANSDTKYPSQKAVKTYADTKVDSVTSSNPHTPVDNSDPQNPIVGDLNAIPITAAQFATDLAGGDLIDGWYLITSVNSQPEQFLFQATGASEAVFEGYGKFIDPDYNNSGLANYSGVQAQTGIVSPAGQYGGVWSQDNEGFYFDNMVVIWNNLHWAVISPPDFNGEAPDVNTDAYMLMEKSFPNVGYLTQWNQAQWGPISNTFLKRKDYLENVIFGADIPLFQFGNSNFTNNITAGSGSINVVNNPAGASVSSNFIESNSALVAPRNNNQIIGNSITGGSYINASDNKGAINYNSISAASGLESDTNEGVIEVCTFRNGAYPYINLNNSVAVTECDFDGDLNFTMPPDKTFSSCRINRKESTFPAVLDITGLSTIDLTTIEYAGIVYLDSSNASETVDEILFGSLFTDITFKIETNGKTVNFDQLNPRASAVSGDILLILGATLSLIKDNDVTDRIDFENQAGIACETFYNQGFQTALNLKKDAATIDPETVEIKIIDDLSVVTTGDGKWIWVVPSQFNGLKIIGVFASVTTTSSSGKPTVQIHNITDAVDVLSTAITIDSGAYISYGASVPPVINTSNDDLATGDRIRIDVDVAGTGAKGLAVGIIMGV